MIEVQGNLWIYPADARVITTNGTVKKDGTCVMGRGCAAEAKRMIPGIDKILGNLLREHGNQCYLLTDSPRIISFPVKHQWFEDANLELIAESAHQLKRLTGQDETIVLPRPGCGNGRLRWEQVEPILSLILDDRFKVITW